MQTFLVAKKPHAVCIPLPFQSHINAMLKVAKILHFRGFHITFVNTDTNHQLLLNSRGPDSLNGFPDFQFEIISDGLSLSHSNDAYANIIDSILMNCPAEFNNLIAKLNQTSTPTVHPKVSCILADCYMGFALKTAEEHGIPGVLLWPMSPSVMMIYLHCKLLTERGLVPSKDKSNLNNLSLDMPINMIPGIKDIRLKDLPSFFWDGNGPLLDVCVQGLEEVSKASAIIINTFDALESNVLPALKSLLPPIYTIGPLQLLEQQIPDNKLRCFRSNLLKEDEDCIQWLDSKQPNSVVYVNFGSHTVMTPENLIEFAWGLANCKHPFLWVIRPGIVVGDAAVLPPEFTEEIANRGKLSGWCPQEQVLAHSSVAGFLTHSGWNSTMDTICGGVPVISWPFLGDQRTNCRYASVHWGFGMELDNDVKREKVERLVRELMEGEKGQELKTKAMEWMEIAEQSTKPGGSSYASLDKLIKQVLV